MTQISTPPHIDGAQKTEALRRRARFRFATDRVTQIADGVPRFTDDELTELAEMLLSRRTGDLTGELAAELSEAQNVA